MSLSKNAVERLCKVFGYLETIDGIRNNVVSSKGLAKAIGATEYTVRKDINSLGVSGYTRKGYDVVSLKKELGDKLQLHNKRKACIVGLGRLGSALLDYEQFHEDGFQIVAGFDSSINKLERIRTSIEVYPDIYMKNIIEQKSIELGIITVPSDSAQAVADKLVESGVKGILNFSPLKVAVPEHIVHMDMDFTNALRFIASQIK